METVPRRSGNWSHAVPHTFHFRALIKQDIAIRVMVEDFGLDSAPCGLGQLTQGHAGKRGSSERPNRMSFRKQPVL